jgi:tellurite resistance protein
VSQSLRFLPAGLFGAVMGLAGLGLASRSAATLLSLPAWLPELWIALAALALAVLLVSYALKTLRHGASAREEISNPALVGFFAAAPVGMALVAAGVEPQLRGLAQVLWWCAVPLMFAVQAWALALLLRGRVTLAHMNGGWLIVLVGGIVMPFAALPLGERALGAFMFTVSAVVAPLVMGAIFWRMKAGPALPPPLRPTWFILLVPPSLIYVNGDTLWPGQGGLAFLYFAVLPLAVALFFAARGCRRWPFGAPWWAFTFPLDALAGAAAHYGRTHPQGPWLALAGALLALATAAVVLVLARTLAALLRGTLLVPPPAPKSA